MSTLAAEPRRAGRRSNPVPEPPRLHFAESPRNPRDFGVAVLTAVILHLLVLAGLLLFDHRDMANVPAVLDPGTFAPRDSLEITYLIPLGPGGQQSAPSAEAGAADFAPAPLFAPRVIPTTIPAPAARPAAPAGTPGGRGLAAEGASAAERLRQRVSDPRLWGAPAIGTPLPKTQVDVVRERIAAQIRALNDSIAAEDAARKRASDWTVKDDDGGRWGISPEGIHLGGITLPAPQFTPAIGSDAAKRISKDREISAQADRARIRDTFKERAEAIRARKDKERREGAGEE